MWMDILDCTTVLLFLCWIVNFNLTHISIWQNLNHQSFFKSKRQLSAFGWVTVILNFRFFMIRGSQPSNFIFAYTWFWCFNLLFWFFKFLLGFRGCQSLSLFEVFWRLPFVWNVFLRIILCKTRIFPCSFWLSLRRGFL